MKKQILYTIEGQLPFSALSRHKIGTKLIQKGNCKVERRIYSDEYNRLFIPIRKYDITEEFLHECFQEAISESEDYEYNLDHDYESKIDYIMPKDFTKFIEFCEKEGYFDECSYFESKSEIEDYIFDIINDHLSDFCEKEVINPDWVEDINERLHACKKCGYIEDLDDLRELY